MAFWNRGSGSDGEVVFSITADNTQAVDAINDTVKEMKRAGNDLSAAADDADQDISKSFTHAFNVERIKNWAIQAGKWLVQFGKEAINAASDLQEVQNVVDATFGESAHVIDEWAAKAASQFGLTETQAKRFTSTLGAMAKSSGLAGNEIITMSTDLAGLAADMASFYNLDFDTAFQKIRSGIAGETEPLKQLGINMSVVNLQAYAMQQGITKAFDKMSQGEQMLLRYQYLMQATADAQGDFARTSDDYANNLRKFESNLEQFKTTIGNYLIEPANNALTNIQKLFEYLSDDHPITVLDRLADVDLEYQDRINEIKMIYDEANTLNEMLLEIASNLSLKHPATDGEGGENADNTEEQQGLFDSEIANLLALGNRSEEARARLTELGFESWEITNAQSAWLDVCKKLVRDIPSLSKVIDVNTGEVKAGSEEIRQYIDAWKEMEETEAYLSALEKKYNVLTENNDVLGRMQDLKLAEQKVRSMEDRIRAAGYDPTDALFASFEGWSLTETKAHKELRKYGDELAGYREEYVKASKAYEAAVEAQTEADKAYIEVKKEYEEAQAKATNSIKEAAIEMTVYERAALGDADALAEVKGAVVEALEALQALEDYQQTVYDDVDRSVRQTINGFNEIVTPAQKARAEIRDAKKELEKLSEADKKAGKDGALNNKIASLQGSLPSVQTMIKGLESQNRYMREYQFLLQQAKEMGLSEGLLSQFSDGSQESYDYLTAIVRDADMIEELNAAYAENETRRGEFTDSLTQTRLEADDQFAQLVQDAQDAVEGLNLEGEAYESVAALVSGIVAALRDKRTEVASEVDAILGIIGRLTTANFGASVSYGGWVGSLVTPHADGLDYVPYDGYLASLHEGETILTAQEAKVWRGFKNGQQDSRNSIDYGRLSSAIWDNAPSMGGGNVYLDGQTVGRVISAQQANAYRSLQRSGWSA